MRRKCAAAFKIILSDPAVKAILAEERELGARINKGDAKKPNYRSIMVGKEFNDREIEVMLAATPPLEALRLILSWAATIDTRGAATHGDARASSAGKSILIADASTAFSEAAARRDICVELPVEALGAGESPEEIVG